MAFADLHAAFCEIVCEIECNIFKGQTNSFCYHRVVFLIPCQQAMPLTQEYKETIAARASTDLAFVKTLREEIANLKGDEKKAASNLLESVLIQARRASAAQGNSVEINVDQL